MVYYGALSNGCERCRKRKVKCDGRKPGCLKCEKFKAQCPGYRDLNSLVFRDESKRVVERACVAHGSSSDSHILAVSLPCSQSNSGSIRDITYAPRQSIYEIAANFYFTNYTYDEPSLAKNYHKWLVSAYYQINPNLALKNAIEAAGMAGISNIHHDAAMAAESKEKYCYALAAVAQALKHPTESTVDITLMTILVFGIYEFVNFESWESYNSWVAHLEDAIALLHIKGKSQFEDDRGAQLFSLLRHQVSYACLQGGSIPPDTFIKIREDFQESTMGKARKQRQPRPMGDICFRLLDLRRDVKNGKLIDSNAIQEAALALEDDLLSWADSLPTTCSYDTVEASNTDTVYFRGKRHIYSNVWMAQLWNHWRSLRILVSRVVLQVGGNSNKPERTATSTRIDLIRQLSTDICVSTTELMHKPPIALIWSLMTVAEEPLNSREERTWAVQHLYRIGSSLGIRQATVLADSVSASLFDSWTKSKISMRTNLDGSTWAEAQ